MVEEYWKKFLVENNLPLDTKCYEAFKFGLNDHQADELLDLVLKDKKVATTSPYFDDETYPKIGDYSIVLDSNNIPRCIIQTIKYTIMPFDEMTYDICKLEGEDEILDTWIKNHKDFLGSKCKEKGLIFSPKILIFFEEFKVVYK